jgi:hypothetical protein
MFQTGIDRQRVLRCDPVVRARRAVLVKADLCRWMVRFVSASDWGVGSKLALRGFAWMACFVRAFACLCGSVVLGMVEICDELHLLSILKLDLQKR